MSHWWQMLLIVGVPSVFIYGAIFRSAKIYRMRQAIKRLARELHGEIVSFGRFETPAVKFAVGGREAWLEFSRGGLRRPPMARVAVNVVDLFSGVLHIVPAGFAQAFLKLFGSQDVVIGDTLFDREYLIKSRPESLATTVFRHDQRREVIHSVRRLRSYPDSRISLDRVNLTVQVTHCRPDADRLMVLVDVARDFLRYLASPPEVVGVHVEEVRIFSGGECPVCGTNMNQEAVRCEVCRTPHHEECWKYMGRCSTYACKGRRCVA